ncbi:DUF551 domain-containing protein [Agrobacterium sp.]|uniref:DUF551 domain-containing protein n=1 Tax=Agrobacterium sp. TaxID=361 RepID=UPI0025C40DFD|nr:DUF551 domain-containing protein [Agrobacterium sp.]MCD4661456.1 DUF551 domain-containing protein [Agrobacterium sp.]
MQSDFQQRAEELYQAGVADGFRAGFVNTLKKALEEAALSAAEPVAWQPRYKQEVIDHLRTVSENVSEYAMTVFQTKDQAEEYGHGGHDVRALYAAPPAPSVAVEDLIAEVHDAIDEYREGMKGDKFGPHEWPTVDGIKTTVAQALRRSALSAQVQDVARWQDISTLEPKDGMIVMGWGEYRERDGFSPAFMRWYDSVGGWSVSAMPFYPTHWMPLPAAPAKQEG